MAKKLLDEKNSGRTESSGSSNSNVSQRDAEDRLSEEDLRNLRRVPGKIPWTAYAVTVLEMAEFLSLHGTLVVGTNFLQWPLPAGSSTGAGFQGQSGGLGLGQQKATAINMAKSLWIGTAPLLGAFVADQYLGRYKTLQWANFVTIVAHVVLTIAALPWVIVHSSISLAIYLLGILLLGIGFGGIKPNITPLLLEQLPITDLKLSTDRKGRRVILDPQVARSRVLLYFFSFANIGSVVGMVSMVYCEKHIGFWLAWTVPTVIFLLCPLILWVFRGSYTTASPESPVFGKAMRLLALSMKGRWSWNPIRTYRSIQQPDFWDRVKPSNIANCPTWMTFDDSWVDEVRCGVQVCKVFCWYPLYWPAVRQLSSNLTSQAATLKLNGLPNDLLVNFNPIFCLIFSPIYAHVIYPGLACLGIHPSPTTRISLGFLSTAIGMAISAVNQHFIYAHSLCGSHANHCIANPADTKISVFIQVPAYVFIANGEVLALVTGMEYAYANAPSNMRSLVMALFYFPIALGCALSQTLVPLSRDPMLVWNYVVAGGFSAVAAVGVWWSNREKREKGKS
ncbi:MFS peptide transporter [Cucurbitaria berberidis CBS 394.84]|uniref:MFS peptide transporter n=1 Tax=Cucurbitaria berberidis CBS 394.84 TaxID=1168544 RepID=A0A9P4GF52_9PLEO|nr:MFS peptide transporter [Cucurbitaria berberidis CBS 394.84]KAF1844045.1 MFS peptide transporter [Cucurbitaria berberidis CBS 394.84]